MNLCLSFWNSLLYCIIWMSCKLDVHIFKLRINQLMSKKIKKYNTILGLQTFFYWHNSLTHFIDTCNNSQLINQILNKIFFFFITYWRFSVFYDCKNFIWQSFKLIFKKKWCQNFLIFNIYCVIRIFLLNRIINNESNKNEIDDFISTKMINYLISYPI